jgi:hypothetical protein
MIFDSMIDESSAAVGCPFLAATTGATRKARVARMAPAGDRLNSALASVILSQAASGSGACLVEPPLLRAGDMEGVRTYM